MTNGNIKRAKLLGMPFGTAQQKLRKAIMFQMIQRLGLDICFQCKQKIEKIENLSIEHKVAWLNSDNPKKLFFDLDNIAFSHHKCNMGVKKNIVNPIKHPSLYAYKKGCRCSECRKLNQLKTQNSRKNKKILIAGIV